MAGYDIPTPNFASAALGGYQAGQAIGQQRRKQAALDLYQTDPEHGLDALSTVDPQLAETLRANKERREKRALLGPIFAPDTAAVATPTAPALGGMATDAQPASTLTPALGGAAALPVLGAPNATGAGAPVAPATAPSPQTVSLQSHGPQINKAAMDRLFSAYPEEAIKIQDYVSKMDDAQRKRLAAGQDALAATGLYLRRLPLEQRTAEIQRLTPDLLRHGVTQDQIAAFDPHDGNIDALVAQSLGTKGILDMLDKQGDNARQESQAAETARHNRATEGTSAGALSLARQREGRVGSKAAAGGAPDLSAVSDDALLRMATGH